LGQKDPVAAAAVSLTAHLCHGAESARSPPHTDYAAIAEAALVAWEANATSEVYVISGTCTPMLETGTLVRALASS